MLLEEDPATLIHVTVSNFNIRPDKDATSRIQDSLETLRQARELKTREADTALKKLARTYNALSSQHADNVASHSSSIHATKMAEMDTQKYRIAKVASALEVETGKLESELEGLRGRLQELELQGVEGSEASRVKREGDDPVVLKLKVYRSLGIDVEPDAAGQYNKAVIRNDKKGDVHVINIDPKFSRYFYANYFWSSL